MEEYKGAMMKYFHWYIAADGQLWRELAADAESPAKTRINAHWLPSAYEGAGGKDDVE